MDLFLEHIHMTIQRNFFVILREQEKSVSITTFACVQLAHVASVCMENFRLFSIFT